MRSILVLSILLASCRSESASTEAPPSPPATTTTARAPAPVAVDWGVPPLDCAGFAAHWRKVWAVEAAPTPRRRERATDHAIRAWGRACAEATDHQEAIPLVLSGLHEVRSFDQVRTAAKDSSATFKALEAAAKKEGERTGVIPPPPPEASHRTLFLLSTELAVVKTKTSYLAPVSVDACEDAIVDVAFCGDEQQRAAVKDAAARKDAQACGALVAALASTCEKG